MNPHFVKDSMLNRIILMHITYVASNFAEITKRPTFNQLKKSLRTAKPSKKSVMDSMMEALEGYVNQLEEKVAERTGNEYMDPFIFRSVRIQLSTSILQSSREAREEGDEVCFMIINTY